MIGKIVAIIIMLYLAVGMVLFRVAVNYIGGKKEYLRFLYEEKGIRYPNVAFWLGFVVFIFSWPYYLLDSVGGSDE